MQAHIIPVNLFAELKLLGEQLYELVQNAMSSSIRMYARTQGIPAHLLSLLILRPQKKIRNTAWLEKAFLCFFVLDFKHIKALSVKSHVHFWILQVFSKTENRNI